MPHHDANGGSLAADLERGLEVGHVARRREDDGPGAADLRLPAGRVRPKIPPYDAGPGRLGPIEPFRVRRGVGDHRHRTAAATQSLDDLEPEPTQTANDDRIHGAGVYRPD